ncbi:MAG TPA: NOP58 family protein [Candidatus Woesearchaeota archaeon]|nr:NOP58 family protein [Candidatus Woesearchaeota archaeon]
MALVYRHITGEYYIGSQEDEKVSEFLPSSFDISLFERLSKKVFKEKDKIARKGIEIAKEKISGKDYTEDLIIQASGLIDESDKTINYLARRLRRLALTIYPELCLRVDDNKKIVEMLLSKEKEEINSLLGIKKSMGWKCQKKDCEFLKEAAGKIKELFTVREIASEFISEKEKRIMPNFSAIAGPSISAKLLSHAGSLRSLAIMPASTIQLLGAEKALFRHITRGSKCPKYGILFQHPAVQGAEKKARGKVARIIADKLSIAARIDFFSKEDKSAELIKEMERRIKDAKRK